MNKEIKNKWNQSILIYVITETPITHASMKNIWVPLGFVPSQFWFHKTIVTSTPHWSDQQIGKRPVGALCFSKGTSISFLLNSLGRLLWFFWKVLFFYQFLKRHNVFEIRNESTEIINTISCRYRRGFHELLGTGKFLPAKNFDFLMFLYFALRLV